MLYATPKSARFARSKPLHLNNEVELSHMVHGSMTNAPPLTSALLQMSSFLDLHQPHDMTVVLSLYMSLDFVQLAWLQIGSLGQELVS
jgi:hypothetical protein